jgi:mono/diheme cytochrome c family protein
LRPDARKLVLAVLLVAGLAAACRQDMHDQPRIEPYEESDFFADGRGNRMPVEGAVARGQLRADEAFYTGLAGDQFVEVLPVEVTRELLDRGRERYDIFCSPCHSRVGDGRGMIVRRGFKQPASFHEQRLRDQKIGYFYDVISRGFGEMSSYAAQVEPEDRWAIAAYIRALQLSQNVVVADLDAAGRAVVEAGLAERSHPAESAAESAAEPAHGSGHDQEAESHD